MEMEIFHNNLRDKRGIGEVAGTFKGSRPIGISNYCSTTERFRRLQVNIDRGMLIMEKNTGAVSRVGENVGIIMRIR